MSIRLKGWFVSTRNKRWVWYGFAKKEAFQTILNFFDITRSGDTGNQMDILSALQQGTW